LELVMVFPPITPRRELTGRSPDPPVRGFFFCGGLQPARGLQPKVDNAAEDDRCQNCQTGL